ncbi:DUF2213 domain-containing protein [Francisella marina]|uniref:DUF2213 domain-containing protein n=1 Tax=Francisella marina TaxID=2249302 RepID=A0ABX5ZH47_9GAMM|nr:DUF2213 domain-containing protein [Francisella marina]QEO57570.1 DUF2213 domain-containing protein [Francisella marina]
MSCCNSCNNNKPCESSNMLYQTAIFDSDSKTFTSVRDGVQKYHKLELGGVLSFLGLDTQKDILDVYRSGDEIRRIAKDIQNVPITNEHIDVVDANGNVIPVKDKDIIARVPNFEVKDFIDDDTDTTTKVIHKISTNKTVLNLLKSGKKELSLGYTSKHRIHDKYDLEQYDIQPHHLAIVDKGRCGEVCQITDSKHKEENMKPEDMKDEFEKLKEENKSLKDELAKMKESKDEDMKKDSEEEKKDVKDSAEFKLAIQEAEKAIVDSAIAEFKDSKEFVAIVDSAIAEKFSVVEKAKQFIPTLDSVNKSVLEIQKEVVSHVLPDVELKDSEIPVAFKTLQKPVVVSQPVADSFNDFEKRCKEYK